MEVNIIRSNRKTIAIQVNPDMSVTVRAPRRASDRDIARFLREKEDWILKHLAQFRKEQAMAKDRPRLTQEELKQLAKQASQVIPERVAYYAGLMGVTYGRITIRHQKTRWGSCSSKGNLNFNCLLMLSPAGVIDYVVVHELCHRIEMNHSKAFWNEVAKVLPNYKESVKWLKEHGREIMSYETGNGAW